MEATPLRSAPHLDRSPNIMRHLLIPFAFMLLSCSTPPIIHSFPAKGISQVVVRTSEAAMATVSEGKPEHISIAAIPSGGTQGYHPSDPSWRETLPKDWGMTFVSQQFGSLLVISAKSEISYIHHHYYLSDIRIVAPPGVSVVREKLRIDGSGRPNLDRPAKANKTVEATPLRSVPHL